MNISDCLDSIQNGNGATNSKTLTANGLEETELIKSIAILLYRTKSVRKCIEILDIISNSEVFNSDDCGNEIILNEISEYKNNENFRIGKIMQLGLKQLSESLNEQEPYSGC